MVKQLVTNMKNQNLTNMKKSNIILGYIIALIISISGCSDGDEKLYVRKITVEPKTLQVAKGYSKIIVPTALPDRITDAVFEWSSENTAIATVDAEGNVTGVSVGSTNIFVKSGEIVKDIPVQVYQPMTAIDLSPNVSTLDLKIRFGVAQAVQFEATPIPSDYAGYIVWKTSDPEVVSVTNTGLVTPVAEGKATITVMGNDELTKIEIAVTVEKEGDDAVQFDPKLFTRTILPNDNYMDRNEWWYLEGIWNGRDGGAGGSSCELPGPQSFTFDMGVTGYLAYFHLFTWESIGEGFPPFFEANLKTFEVWGSESLDTSGSWDSWTKLMDCEVIKPSGLPLGEYNNDDIAAYNEGQKFYNIDKYDVAVRYIRVKVLETWGGDPCWRINEIELYGTPQ